MQVAPEVDPLASAPVHRLRSGRPTRRVNAVHPGDGARLSDGSLAGDAELAEVCGAIVRDKKPPQRRGSQQSGNDGEVSSLPHQATRSCTCNRATCSSITTAVMSSARSLAKGLTVRSRSSWKRSAV